MTFNTDWDLTGSPDTDSMFCSGSALPATGSRDFEPIDPGALTDSVIWPSSRRRGWETFAELTTFGLGGSITNLVRANSEEELVAAVRDADAQDCPVLVLGGGSNLLIENFAGLVVVDDRHGMRIDSEPGCGGVLVSAPAGQPWDEFVAATVAAQWSGLEALSGIPGTVGAAPVQNIGAYGHEFAETAYQMRVYDRAERKTRKIPAGALHFGYRSSDIKRSLADAEVGGGREWGPTGRYVVLEVTFQFQPDYRALPVKYQQLADQLGVATGDRPSARDVRTAVLDLRSSKGMILDDADRDTWSAGSFFTNPILTASQAARLPAEAPRFTIPADEARLIRQFKPVETGQLYKSSAAWLIHHSGFEPGFRMRPDAPAALSSKHVLALTNLGGATAADVFELADMVATTVSERYGITLTPEPVILR
ncbi:MAG: UDP-N-acetylmuramate dehydrogenase [Varibaculum sp.]|nr:UDP-N-acetylmuramate dehydrogenase [Varibaculum sp.]